MKTVLVTICLLAHTCLFAQWTDTKGPYGANVVSLVAIGDKLFAGTSESGVMMSADKGKSWSSANEGLTSLKLVSLVAINGNLFAASYGVGVFQSSSNGSSWTRVNTGLATLSVSTLRATASHVYVRSDSGLYRYEVGSSSSGGSSWEYAGNGVDRGAYVLGSNSTYIYAGYYTTGVYRSSNFGDSWQECNNGLTTPQSKNVRGFASIGNKAFLGTWGGGVFTSTDGGDNWTESNSGLSDFGRIILGLEVINGSLYLLTYDGVYISTDLGASWVSKGLGGLPLSGAMSLAGSSEIFVSTVGSGVYVSSNNGTDWEQSALHADGITVLSILTTDDHIYVGSRGGGVFRSSKNSIKWNLHHAGMSQSMVTSLASVGTTLFAGFLDGGGIYRLSEGNESWEPAGDYSSGLDNTYIFTLKNIDDKLYAGTWGGGVYVSTNRGGSWKQSAIKSARVLTIESNNDNIYVGMVADGIFKSNDQGDSWESMNDGLRDKNVAALAFSGSHIFAGTWAGLFISTNDGFSWEKSSSALGDSAVQSIVVVGSKVYAATDGSGVFSSTDLGSTWQSVGTGISTLKAVRLAVVDSLLLVATEGNGVWSIKIDNPTSVAELVDDPSNTLHVFPNPVTNKSTVQFSLRSHTGYSLKIFDSQGALVGVQEYPNTAPGPQRIDLNTGNLSVGNYSVLVLAGEEVYSTKVAVVK